ncbi:MAG: diguanylate cyclase [Sinobacteraceae bacterium]|nr:diguanylate cyclase [Nevskiaceae bacterium]MCP5359457.1 diguanylate cyclase [Nevskiaceae bacterium]
MLAQASEVQVRMLMLRRLLLAIVCCALLPGVVTLVTAAQAQPASAKAAVAAQRPKRAAFPPGPGNVRATLLDLHLAGAEAAVVTSGDLDGDFGDYDFRLARQHDRPYWLRLDAAGLAGRDDQPVLVARKGWHLDLEPYAPAAIGGSRLERLTGWTTFRGRDDVLFALPGAWQPDMPLYLRVVPRGSGAEELQLSIAPLGPTLVTAARQSQVIAAAVGALLAMSIAALLIWFILAERLFVLYAILISLQALYIAYLSGAGFDWPVLERARPLAAHAWNVPAALSGAAAALFAREIADLRRFWPRIYHAFGWLAAAFVLLAVANVTHLFGFGSQLARVGNLMFLGSAAFTLVAAWLAWRRGSRAAGWFLVAWTLLEVSTIATAGGFLVSSTDPWTLAWSLPASMVVAAVFVALGVADRLREQRRALSDAERRAQTDPLTGVLNRRSLLERLDAACLRAQARGLPISLLFIDLDHFKSINDTWGHQAGDACLLAVIRPIQAELRQSDVIGRYGGEEFVVVLSSADAGAAQAIAARILERVADLTVEGFGTPIRLTCSIGVASSETLGVWGEQLISKADAAVYAAKHSGRNQVKVAALAA